MRDQTALWAAAHAAQAEQTAARAALAAAKKAEQDALYLSERIPGSYQGALEEAGYPDAEAALRVAEARLQAAVDAHIAALLVLSQALRVRP